MRYNIKEKENCKYDLLSLGEVMLRFDPGDMRIKTAREFKVFEGGGEYNVARGLSKCFEKETGIITGLVKNDIGYLIEELIDGGKVDSSLIVWKDFDGIGKESRNSLKFTERGFGIRGALGVSDRGHSPTSQLKIEDLDFDYIFGKLGTRWFHTGGIFAALSESSGKLALEAVKKAKEYGTIVSYDLNYRPSLWKDHGGIEECRKINREIAKYVDIMIGNEEDYTACLGFEIEGNSENLENLNIDGYKKMLKAGTKEYKNWKGAATTLREVSSASFNNWSAILYLDGEFYKSKEFKDLEILDRVGGGDSFASGLIYGFLEQKDPETIINYGAAHGAFAMTTPGDTSMAKKEEIENIITGGTARVKR